MDPLLPLGENMNPNYDGLGVESAASWSVFLSAELCGPISLLRLRGSTETLHVSIVTHSESPRGPETNNLHHCLQTPVEIAYLCCK